MKQILFLSAIFISVPMLRGAEIIESKFSGSSPLFGIIERRQMEGFNNQSLTTAKLTLSYPSRQKWMSEMEKLKYNPNYQQNIIDMTPLQCAAQIQDKDLCWLFFEYGGDPTIKTRYTNLDGRVLHGNAFYFANKALTKADQLHKQDHGWLEKLWENYQSKKAFTYVSPPQSGDIMAVMDKSNISGK